MADPKSSMPLRRATIAVPVPVPVPMLRGMTPVRVLAAVLMAACSSEGEPPLGEDDTTTTTTATTEPPLGECRSAEWPSGQPTWRQHCLGSASDGSTSGDPDTTSMGEPKLDLAPILDTPDTGETGGGPVDCDALTPLPLSYVTIFGPASSEDFVFDADGHLVNVANGGDLLQAEYGTPSTLLFPGVGPGFAAGTAMRPNGDVVFNSGGQVRRVATDGSVEIIAAGLSYPNGLTVSMEGLVYVAEQSGGRVVSIDPDTLAVEVIAQDLQNPNGIAFDSSYENLYVGSFGGGTVTKINVPTGAVEVYAENIGGGGLDGVIVDACDNVYVTDYGPGLVWRVEGDTHEMVVELPAGWIPNMHFGSGVGGWNSWRLYVISISGDQVFELDLGVPGIPLPQL